ncbi:DNA-directed RNA polymerase, mitochondrial [Strongyloides ratti]|uniref:DNA-directed RNA polymerase n=1 Tax=Strongyloides ratti TaxID=34506 RepID=A0A090LEF3_STRRB|nr:DNA-directed RNA polymerase, mitochondrial [Strongyloides ratti]CEF65895.1 DNA-directed RNA polymerase, mitochondrial [Strongyloides ratti]
MKKVISQNLLKQLVYRHKLCSKYYMKDVEKAKLETLIIGSYINNDYLSIIQFLLPYKPNIDDINKTNYIHGIGLSILRKLFNEMNNERDKLKLFFNSVNFLKTFSIENNVESQLGFLLLVHDFQNWYESKELSCTEKIQLKDELQELWKRAQSKKLIKPYLFNTTRIYSKEDFEIASNIAFKIQNLTRKPKIEKIESRYNRNLTLVDSLQYPVDESNYILGMEKAINSKKQFMSLFKKQLINEQETYFKTQNIFRTSTEKITAEEIIDGLDWLPKIEKTFSDCLKNLDDSEVVTFLSLFKANEISEILHKEIMKLLSYGQNMVNYGYFEKSIIKMIFQRIQKDFMNDLLKHDDEMLIQVFDKYVDFFLNDNLRRLFRPREYWIKVCNDLKVNPDISLPFSDLNLWTIRSKLAIFFSNIISKSCKLTNDQLIEIAKRHPELSLNLKYTKELKIFSVKSIAKVENEIFYDEFIDPGSKFFIIDGKFLEYLNIYQFKELFFYSGVEMPMLTPPRPYLDYGKGGPLYTLNSSILKDKKIFLNVHLEKQMEIRLKNKYQGRPIWDALNELGCVPWKINKPVLEIMTKLFTEFTSNINNEIFLENLGFPMNPNVIVIPKINDFINHNKISSDDKSKFREFFKMKQLLENKKTKMNSLTYWMLYRLSIAHYFEDSILYFPHNIDFRGRVYPISPYLSHMGDDVSRSLLIFANGRKLGPNGLRWLKLHCINLTGFLKKESIETRLEYAEKVLDDKIRDSARDPLNGSRWWMESEEPWQTLTACIEINNALMLDDPSEFISCMPVHQDGSCNGLQHYAALGRDKDGGGEVNLLPAEKPADIYSVVAMRVDSKREKDEKSNDNSIRDIALILRNEIPDKLPRKLLKQTIMTTVYGVTEYGAVLQIAKQLKNLRINDNNVGILANYLKNQTLASLSEAFKTSMEIKEWFRKCAEQITRMNRSVEWVTPLGLPVYQPYMKIELDGIDEYQVPIKSKQINAFPPNYIHSLDSTHMMLTALNCTAKNVEFAAVHDCFWTHAGTVEEMNKITRDEFIKLHNEPLIENLANHFKKTYVYDNPKDEIDTKRQKLLLEVFNPKIEKGQLDINEIRNSVYFFS